MFPIIEAAGEDIDFSGLDEQTIKQLAGKSNPPCFSGFEFADRDSIRQLCRFRTQLFGAQIQSIRDPESRCETDLHDQTVGGSKCREYMLHHNRLDVIRARKDHLI